MGAVTIEEVGGVPARLVWEGRGYLVSHVLSPRVDEAAGAVRGWDLAITGDASALDTWRVTVTADGDGWTLAAAHRSEPAPADLG